MPKRKAARGRRGGVASRGRGKAAKRPGDEEDNNKTNVEEAITSDTNLDQSKSEESIESEDVNTSTDVNKPGVDSVSAGEEDSTNVEGQGDWLVQDIQIISVEHTATKSDNDAKVGDTKKEDLLVDAKGDKGLSEKLELAEIATTNAELDKSENTIDTMQGVVVVESVQKEDEPEEENVIDKSKLNENEESGASVVSVDEKCNADGTKPGSEKEVMIGDTEVISDKESILGDTEIISDNEIAVCDTEAISDKEMAVDDTSVISEKESGIRDTEVISDKESLEGDTPTISEKEVLGDTEVISDRESIVGDMSIISEEKVLADTEVISDKESGASTVSDKESMADEGLETISVQEEWTEDQPMEAESAKELSDEEVQYVDEEAEESQVDDADQSKMEGTPRQKGAGTSRRVGGTDKFEEISEGSINQTEQDEVINESFSDVEITGETLAPTVSKSKTGSKPSKEASVSKSRAYKTTESLEEVFFATENDDTKVVVEDKDNDDISDASLPDQEPANMSLEEISDEDVDVSKRKRKSIEAAAATNTKPEQEAAPTSEANADIDNKVGEEKAESEPTRPVVLDGGDAVGTEGKKRSASGDREDSECPPAKQQKIVQDVDAEPDSGAAFCTNICPTKKVAKILEEPPVGNQTNKGNRCVSSLDRNEPGPPVSVSCQTEPRNMKGKIIQCTINPVQTAHQSTFVDDFLTVGAKSVSEFWEKFAGKCPSSVPKSVVADVTSIPSQKEAYTIGLGPITFADINSAEFRDNLFAKPDKFSFSFDENCHGVYKASFKNQDNVASLIRDLRKLRLGNRYMTLSLSYGHEKGMALQAVVNLLYDQDRQARDQGSAKGDAKLRAKLQLMSVPNSISKDFVHLLFPEALSVSSGPNFDSTRSLILGFSSTSLAEEIVACYDLVVLNNCHVNMKALDYVPNSSSTDTQGTTEEGESVIINDVVSVADSQDEQEMSEAPDGSKNSGTISAPGDVGAETTEKPSEKVSGGVVETMTDQSSTVQATSEDVNPSSGKEEAMDVVVEISNKGEVVEIHGDSDSGKNEQIEVEAESDKDNGVELESDMKSAETDKEVETAQTARLSVDGSQDTGLTVVGATEKVAESLIEGIKDKVDSEVEITDKATKQPIADDKEEKESEVNTADKEAELESGGSKDKEVSEVVEVQTENKKTVESAIESNKDGEKSGLDTNDKMAELPIEGTKAGLEDSVVHTTDQVTEVATEGGKNTKESGVELIEKDKEAGLKVEDTTSTETTGGDVAAEISDATQAASSYSDLVVSGNTEKMEESVSSTSAIGGEETGETQTKEPVVEGQNKVIGDELEQVVIPGLGLGYASEQNEKVGGETQNEEAVVEAQSMEAIPGLETAKTYEQNEEVGGETQSKKPATEDQIMATGDRLERAIPGLETTGSHLEQIIPGLETAKTSNQNKVSTSKNLEDVSDEETAQQQQQELNDKIKPCDTEVVVLREDDGKNVLASIDLTAEEDSIISGGGKDGDRQTTGGNEATSRLTLTDGGFTVDMEVIDVVEEVNETEKVMYARPSTQRSRSPSVDRARPRQGNNRGSYNYRPVPARESTAQRRDVYRHPYKSGPPPPHPSYNNWNASRPPGAPPYQQQYHQSPVSAYQPYQPDQSRYNSGPSPYYSGRQRSRERYDGAYRDRSRSRDRYDQGSSRRRVDRDRDNRSRSRDRYNHGSSHRHAGRDRDKRSRSRDRYDSSQRHRGREVTNRSRSRDRYNHGSSHRDREGGSMWKSSQSGDRRREFQVPSSGDAYSSSKRRSPAQRRSRSRSPPEVSPERNRHRSPATRHSARGSERRPQKKESRSPISVSSHSRSLSPVSGSPASPQVRHSQRDEIVQSVKQILHAAKDIQQKKEKRTSTISRSPSYRGTSSRHNVRPEKSPVRQVIYSPSRRQQGSRREQSPAHYSRQGREQSPTHRSRRPDSGRRSPSPDRRTHHHHRSPSPVSSESPPSRSASNRRREQREPAHQPLVHRHKYEADQRSNRRSQDRTPRTMSQYRVDQQQRSARQDQHKESQARSRYIPATTLPVAPPVMAPNVDPSVYNAYLTQAAGQQYLPQTYNQPMQQAGAGNYAMYQQPQVAPPTGASHLADAYQQAFSLLQSAIGGLDQPSSSSQPVAAPSSRNKSWSMGGNALMFQRILGNDRKQNK